MNSSATDVHGDSDVHGGPDVYGDFGRATFRLGDQADALAGLLHADTAYPAGSRVLEVGCGVGAQTIHLVDSSPGARFVAIDRSQASLARARARVRSHAPDAAVEWWQADLFDLPFEDASFDHVVACFVLEHLADPADVLRRLARVLRPGGTITVIEGDHGSAFFHPDSAYARAAIGHLVTLRAAAGGDGLIGRRLRPLLLLAGYDDVEVGSRTMYVDDSRPELMGRFTRNTFIAMVASVGDEAYEAGLTTALDWDRGIADLHRTAQEGGTFQYSFFKGVARRPVI